MNTTNQRYVPMPSDNFCTISLDHYISLVRKETRLDAISRLYFEGNLEGAHKLLEEYIEEGEING